MFHWYPLPSGCKLALLIIRHITDSNSWPLDLSSHPELAQNGAYGPDQKYTDSDIKQIVQYAGEVGLKSQFHPGLFSLPPLTSQLLMDIFQSEIMRFTYIC